MRDTTALAFKNASFQRGKCTLFDLSFIKERYINALPLIAFKCFVVTVIVCILRSLGRMIHFITNLHQVHNFQFWYETLHWQENQPDILLLSITYIFQITNKFNNFAILIWHEKNPRKLVYEGFLRRVAPALNSGDLVKTRIAKPLILCTR